MEIVPKIKAQFKSVTKNILSDKGFIIIEFRAIPLDSKWNRNKYQMKFNVFGGAKFGNTLELKAILDKLQLDDIILIGAHIEPNEFNGNPYTKIMVDNIELMTISSDQLNIYPNNKIPNGKSLSNQNVNLLSPFDDCPF